MLINLCTRLFIITLTFKILIANRIMSNFQCKDQDCTILHRTSHGLLVQWQKTPLHCLCKSSFMLSSFFIVHFDWLYMLQVKIIFRLKCFSLDCFSISLLRLTKENAHYSAGDPAGNVLQFHSVGAILDWLPGKFSLNLMCSVFLTRELVSISWYSFKDETLDLVFITGLFIIFLTVFD